MIRKIFVPQLCIVLENPEQNNVYCFAGELMKHENGRKWLREMRYNSQREHEIGVLRTKVIYFYSFTRSHVVHALSFPSSLCLPAAVATLSNISHTHN